MSIRVATVGLGLMGTRLLESMRTHAGFQPLVGVDTSPERCRAAAGRFGVDATTDLDSVLRRDDLDLIYVATPPASHIALGGQVLASGRALLVEKPLAVDLESAQAFVDATESSEPAEARAAVNFPFATLPGLRRFQRELQSGEAGEPLRVEIELHFSQWPRTWHKAGEWLSGPVEGGFLREVFSHFAFLTNRLFEPLTVLDARVESAVANQTETRVSARLAAGSIPVQLTGGAGGAAPDFNCWTLYCTKRSYRVEDWSKVRISEGARWYDLMPESGESFGLDAQLDELAKLVRGEANVMPSLREGLNVLRVVEGIHSSSGK
ncbi:MAG: 1,5-anhydro-D-fructose reductase (1,5-anhydro-D-mannitol-forming) [Planctomycetota bacterium]|jgi:1,5-anhydro-D-fructose reductase (1,5-anhydro-D-mannitol-forming)